MSKTIDTATDSGTSPISGRVGSRRLDREEPGEAEISRVLVANVERHRRRPINEETVSIAPWRMSPTDRELGELFRQPQERGRRLRGLSLRLEQLGVRDRDRGMGGEHLEQPLVLLVEGSVAEARQDDDALHRSPTVIGTASIDSKMSSVSGIWTANSTSLASGVSNEVRCSATHR